MSQMAERYIALDHAIDVVQSAGLRVLRPFVARARTLAHEDDAVAETLDIALESSGAAVDAPADHAPLMRALIIDTETTGPDPKKDQIIQLGMVAIMLDPVTGEVHEITEKTVMLEEPKVPISPEAFEVHGITAERVQGQRFDDAVVFAAIAASQLLLAHNAKFDRPLFDRRFPGYLSTAPRPWGCTYADIPWRKARYSSAALGALLIEHCGQFFEGHDAGEDCAATAECLATPFHTTTLAGDARWPLWHVLARVQQPAKRVFACMSPFEFKDRLQSRGYRWNDPSKSGAAFPREPKAWYREVSAEELDTELAWLTQHAYVHGDARLMAHVTDVSPLARFAAA